MRLPETRLKAIVILTISGLVIFLNQRLNFDMHHDGLILTNFVEIRRSFQNDGFWPFNQYGVTWLIPYLPIILTGHENSIYERANSISLLIFILTLLISFVTARRFLTLNRAILVPAFLASTASLGSLRTWPSVSAMLYLATFLLAAVVYFSRDESISGLKRASFFMGLLIPMIVFSRVQVGILLLLSFSIVVFKFGITGTRKYFYSSIIVTTFFLAFFLESKNWLSSLISDTFVYSLNYLTNDETRVIPTFTIIGSLFVLIIFSLLLSNKLTIKLGWLLTISVAFVLFLLLLLYVKTSLVEGPGSITTSIIVMRRLFVSTLIGTFLYHLIDLARNLIKGQNDLEVIPDVRIISVVLVAAASLLQLIPLFDSTHAWWASPPLVILLILLVDKVLLRYFKFNWTKISLKILAMLLIPLLLFSAYTYNLEKKHLLSFDPRFMSAALGSQSEVIAQSQLSRMVFRVVPANSRILNLCINSNIFLTSKSYQSASRFYISWPNMRGYSSYVNSIRVSQPDFILTCSDLPNPAAGSLKEVDRDDLRASQDEIMKQIFLQPIRKGNIFTAQSIEWELWSDKK